MSVGMRRCLPVRVVLCALLVFLFGGAGLAVAASPCTGNGPAIELRIVAGGIAPDIDRTTLVSVYDDGCTWVHRPSYRRDAGEYRVDLDTAALDALQRRVDQPALRGFDAKRLSRELAAADRKKADGSASRQSEPDGDYYELRWHSAGKAASAGWTALPAAAAQYADNETLQQMAAAVRALEALASRSDAKRIGGGTP
jgi:hypothetical protein